MPDEINDLIMCTSQVGPETLCQSGTTEPAIATIEIIANLFAIYAITLLMCTVAGLTPTPVIEGKGSTT